jgi:hypothetical protein
MFNQPPLLEDMTSKEHNVLVGRLLLANVKLVNQDLLQYFRGLFR